MKLAIISDIHGNYPALKNVIEDARYNKVDNFVFIGDYIFDLPFSNEVISMIMGLDNAYVIKGNKEAYLIELSKSNQQDWVYDQLGGIYQTFRDLSGEAHNYLLGLEDDCYITLDNGFILYAAHFFNDIKYSKQKCSSSGYHKKMLAEPFTHEQFIEDFYDTLAQDDTKKAIDAINASVILFGHNHLQGHWHYDGKLIINPGSCGQPLDFNADAAYTILETSKGGYEVTERRVSYDIDSTISLAKKSTLYMKGKVWSELVFLALRTGRDYFGLFFEAAHKIADSRGERGELFTNETWLKTYESVDFLRD